jgi:ribonuclease P protein component
MLPRRNHILRRDFDALFQKARWYRGISFTAKILHTSGIKNPQFSCVVAKKHINKAVDRHTVKRRTYHVLSSLLSRITPTTQAILFFQGKKIPTFSEIEKEIVSLLQQSKSL